jgi:predicted dehydrogenase
MYVEVIHRWFGWTAAVNAQTQIFVPQRTDETGARLAVEIPDQILFNAEMAVGMPVQFVFSAAVHHGIDTIEIYGSEATLRYDVAADTLYGARAGEAMSPVSIKPEDAYDVESWRVEQDFVDAVRKGTQYHPNFEDGMRYMHVVEAVYEAAGSGRRVALGS